MSAQTAETVNTQTATATKKMNSASVEVLHQDESYYEIDVLSQFRANLNQLEELNSRLHFMMNEVAGLVKKK
jgi:hypothetical protein